MPPRPVHSSSVSAANTPYSLSLLSEYTHTLDSLPLDLSRNFADLRELDAVLSSSMSSITTKIHKLITMIEQNSSQKDERLLLLSDIADEANRLKLGGEDKIRVACQAADSLKGHSAHMRSLLEHLPGFDPTSIVKRKTTYPHISAKSYMPVGGMEGGRRRRGGFGSLLASGVESPSKRKRVARDDDGERFPRKDRTGEGPSRPRNTGGRAKKNNDRGPSPAESVLSITSHQQPAQHERPHLGASRLSQTINSRPGTNSTNKRSSRPPMSHHGSANGNHQAQDPKDSSSNGRRDAFTTPTSQSRSVVKPFGHYDLPLRFPSQLEGPGVPPVGAYAPSTSKPTVDMDIDEPDGVGHDVEAEVEGDGEDEARYCYCHGISHGEMVGCDGANCKMAWFHLECIGLSEAPAGNWYCEVCRVNQKSTPRRGGRGGKRRAGGRAGKSAASNAA